MEPIRERSCYDCARAADVLLPDGRWVKGCVMNEEEHRRDGAQLDVECIDWPETACDDWEE